ncbi:MAG: ATP-binding protein [Candidatus Berkiella sp.]
MILRKQYLEELERAFRVHPIVGILGPRQCGKTTLAKQYLDTLGPTPNRNYFDLEDSTDLSRLIDPKIALENLSGLIIIDEIQRIPELFPTLRVLVDANKDKQKYLILGSASQELLKQSSESLAGRIEYLSLSPLSFFETNDWNKLWLRGGFPNSYLAIDDDASLRWRNAYIRTFLERDIPNLGIQLAPGHLHRFWMMLAHYHGNTMNYSELAKSMNISSKTAMYYLDILVGTFMIRRLQPWHENISKRQVKAPKIYFRDSGLYHALLQIQDADNLYTHPKLGASWEGFALEEIIRQHHIAENEAYFWATHNQAELDLLLFHKGKRLGFEFKYTSTPKVTKSMHIAIQDLNLDHLTIVYPGKKSYQLDERIFVSGFDVIGAKSHS